MFFIWCMFCSNCWTSRSSFLLNTLRTKNFVFPKTFEKQIFQDKVSVPVTVPVLGKLEAKLLHSSWWNCSWFVQKVTVIGMWDGELQVETWFESGRSAFTDISFLPLDSTTSCWTLLLYVLFFIICCFGSVTSYGWIHLTTTERLS